MMVTVVNIYKTPDFNSKPGDVRIDRTTKWGNPFRIGQDGTRIEVCEKYKRYFEHQERIGTFSITELRNAKRLGCWCKPLQCHGDYLKERIEKLQNSSNIFK